FGQGLGHGGLDGVGVGFAVVADLDVVQVGDTQERGGPVGLDGSGDRGDFGFGLDDALVGHSGLLGGRLFTLGLLGFELLGLGHLGRPGRVGLLFLPLLAGLA